MGSRIVPAFILLAFLSTLTLGALFTVPVAANPAIIIEVGPGEEYETIQDAINAARAGDTILVHAGTYHEHVIVNKSITLKGASSNTTFIDGDGAEGKPVVSIKASDVEIRGFTIQNGSQVEESGCVQIMHNVSVTIRNNVIRKSYYGIFLSKSNSCNIIDNTITDNYAIGIRFSRSSYNRIIGNNITNNPTGISTASINNTLYHNNFINNTFSAESKAYTIWDNGVEGNYWSDHHGVDTDGNGILDTPYHPEVIMMNPDRFPLKEPWSLFRVHRVLLNEQVYKVTTHCNSTVASFKFSLPGKHISFNVTGPSGAVAFCNVTIPKVLLNASSGNWMVFLNYTNITDKIVKEENDTHTFIYFMFSLSTSKVKIIGTDVIPEFPAALFLPMLMIATLIATVLVRRRESKSHSQRFRG